MDLILTMQLFAIFFLCSFVITLFIYFVFYFEYYVLLLNFLKKEVDQYPVFNVGWAILGYFFYILKSASFDGLSRKQHPLKVQLFISFKMLVIHNVKKCPI